MPGDWFECSQEAVSHYAAKATVCGDVAPRRVIEIGTRCGYSLMAFHAAAPTARFLCIDGGLDADSDTCRRHWLSVVDALGIDAESITADSHDLRGLPPADFAHVDGDHSYLGALLDLYLVQHVPVILADDCCNPNVGDAVEKFCRVTGRQATYYHDGLRRAAVIAGAS